MKKTGYILLLLSVLFYGCTEKEELNDMTAGKTYYPMAIGDYRIYNVSHTRWENNAVKYSDTFQIRERVDTLFNNLAGEATYKIIRSKRPTSSDAWVDDSVITVTLSN